MSGAEVGSTSLEYIPQKPRSEFKRRIDTGTAGSISLIAQTIIPISIFAGLSLDVELIGGTEVPNAPTIDYIVRIVRPVYEMLGAELSIEIERRGYYPRGGGIVRIQCKPGEVPCRDIELVSEKKFAPKESEVSVLTISRSLPDHVARRQLESARALLRSAGYSNVRETCDSSGPALSPGSSILVTSGLVGASSLGDRGKRAETVGEEAAGNFIQEFDCNPGVDSHLADMLVTLIPCGKGSGLFTTPRITEHFKTNVEVVRKFIPDCNFELTAPNGEGSCWKVSVVR